MHCRRFLERPADPPRDARPLRQRVRGRRPGGPAGRARRTAPTSAARPDADPLAPRPPHFPAKARSVIFLYMDGGPSQVDTFDPKPRLDREHGQPIKVKTQPTQFNNVGNVLKSPLEVPPVRRERHPGQRPVPARRPSASTTWRSSGRWSRTSPSTPPPTTSCTPAAASRAGRATGRG